MLTVPSFDRPIAVVASNICNDVYEICFFGYSYVNWIVSEFLHASGPQRTMHLAPITAACKFLMPLGAEALNLVGKYAVFLANICWGQRLLEHRVSSARLNIYSLRFVPVPSETPLYYSRSVSNPYVILLLKRRQSEFSILEYMLPFQLYL